MIKTVLEISPRWAVAGFLLFTQVHAQTHWLGPSSYHPNSETKERWDSFWADVDYLYWKIQNSHEPAPLVIQGPSSVVLGGKNIDMGWRSGGRFALGC